MEAEIIHQMKAGIVTAPMLCCTTPVAAVIEATCGQDIQTVTQLNVYRIIAKIKKTKIGNVRINETIEIVGHLPKLPKKALESKLELPAGKHKVCQHVKRVTLFEVYRCKQRSRP